VNKDGAGTLKTGAGAGDWMLVPGTGGLAVGEYAPNTVKKQSWGWSRGIRGRCFIWCACSFPRGRIAGTGRGGRISGLRSGHAAIMWGPVRWRSAVARGKRMIGKDHRRIDYPTPERIC